MQCQVIFIPFVDQHVTHKHVEEQLNGLGKIKHIKLKMKQNGDRKWQSCTVYFGKTVNLLHPLWHSIEENRSYKHYIDESTYWLCVKYDSTKSYVCKLQRDVKWLRREVKDLNLKFRYDIERLNDQFRYHIERLHEHIEYVRNDDYVGNNLTEFEFY